MKKIKKPTKIRKLRFLGYLALVVIPVTAACSLGRDNTVRYVVNGALRTAFVQNLTQNYWVNYDRGAEENNTSLNNIYDSLLKETGIGVTLSYMQIASIVDKNDATKVVKPAAGEAANPSTIVLFNCQVEKTAIADDATDEVKTKYGISPNPLNCNESDSEMVPYLNNNYTFNIDVTYEGSSKYATAEIPSGTKVKVCAGVTYSRDSSNALIANVDQVTEGSCS